MFRLLLAMGFVFALAACEAPAPAISPAQVELFAAELEARARQDVGTKPRSNFRLIGVARKGPLVRLDIQPTGAGAVSAFQTNPELAGRVATEVMTRQMCRDQQLGPMLRAGLVIQIRHMSPARKPWSTSQIASCSGV